MSYSSKYSPEEIKEVIETIKELRQELEKSLPECPDEMIRWEDISKKTGTSYYRTVELASGLCDPRRPFWTGEQKCAKCAKDGAVYNLKIVCAGIKGCFLVGEIVKGREEAFYDLFISIASYGINVGAKIYGRKHPEIGRLLQLLGNVEPIPPSEEDLAAIKTYLKSLKNKNIAPKGTNPLKKVFPI